MDSTHINNQTVINERTVKESSAFHDTLNKYNVFFRPSVQPS